MKNRRALVIKVALSVALSLLAAWGVLRTHGFFETADPAERYRLLCDGFFVPGALLVCAGALIFASNHGAFYGISYSARYVARMFVPWSGRRDESFGDFVMRREEKGRVRGYAFLFWVGGAFLAAALVFLILFYWNLEG